MTVTIVKQGDIRLTVPWFLRQDWTCSTCTCIFHVSEVSDVKYESGMPWDPLDEPYFWVECPTCKAHVHRVDTERKGPYGR